MPKISLKKFLKSATILTLITIFVGGGLLLYNIPSQIKLIQGQENSFNLCIPAKIHVEEDESIGVLSVNNEKVAENIHINLSQPFTVTPEKSGHTKLSLNLFGLIPVKTLNVEVIPPTSIIPCGKAVGVTMTTKGIMVLGTGFVQGIDDEVHEPAKGFLKSGDLIITASGKTLEKKEDLIEIVKENGENEIEFTINRDGELQNISLSPVESADDKSYKLGIWVRDSTQGIGTVTYYNPDTDCFGALGHGIYDVDTGKLMTVKSGNLIKSNLTGVKKGEKGSPGELMGTLDKSTKFGEIKINTQYGVYGTIYDNSTSFFEGKRYPIALQNEIEEGDAVILTNINGDKIEEFSVKIEKVNRFSSNADKGMVIKITDEKLLNQTNGIVQGMSGSPIIQNDKIIGAVTHVFVHEPSKGYGIFIENMLEEEKNAA